MISAQTRSAFVARENRYPLCANAALRSGSCPRLPCAPERYRANNECTPRSPRVQPFSALPDLARLSRRIQECETRFRPSSSTCAFLRGALPRHREGLPSSIRLARAEKPHQLHPSPSSHSVRVFFIQYGDLSASVERPQSLFLHCG